MSMLALYHKNIKNVVVFKDLTNVIFSNDLLIISICQVLVDKLHMQWHAACLCQYKQNHIYFYHIF